MNRIRISRRGFAACSAAIALATVLFVGTVPTILAQGPGQAPGQAPPAPPPVGPVKLDLGDGSSASYRVREQLAGISFPSDAVGTTSTFTGTLALNADGTVNSSASKLSIDLRN